MSEGNSGPGPISSHIVQNAAADIIEVYRFAQARLKCPGCESEPGDPCRLPSRAQGGRLVDMPWPCLARYHAAARLLREAGRA